MLIVSQVGQQLKSRLIKRRPKTKHIPNPDICDGIAVFGQPNQRSRFLKPEFRHGDTFTRSMCHIGDLHSDSNFSELVYARLKVVNMSIDFIETFNCNKTGKI